jgi:hypothetical protein
MAEQLKGRWEAGGTADTFRQKRVEEPAAPFAVGPALEDPRRGFDGGDGQDAGERGDATPMREPKAPYHEGREPSRPREEPLGQTCAELCRALHKQGTLECELVGEDLFCISIDRDGDDKCVAGRLPRDQAIPDRGTIRSLSSWATHTASLEASAVDAFFELARDLERHGAPAKLGSEARRAADDERRHTHAMLQLAGRGLEGLKIARATGQAASLFELAKHNATEGCVREAYAALEAAHQAEYALSPEVRHTMTRIAADEARHALLSLDILEWSLALLSPRERRDIQAARDAACAALLASRTERPQSQLDTVLGIPTGERAATLIGALG